MTLLRVSYRLRAHHMAPFEKIFADRIAPLVREHGLHMVGVWRTAVGDVGEYMELWRFDSMADFEARWKTFIDDPRLQEVFETTGPMVESERFTLLDPVLGEIR